MQIIFFDFSSEAEHVLALFLFFGQIETQCSYKVCSYEKERSVSENFIWAHMIWLP